MASGGDTQGWSSRFRRWLTRWTSISQLGPFVAMGWLLRGQPWWLMFGVATATALVTVWATGPLVLDQLPDRRRSRVRVYALEIPFLIHWLAGNFSTIGLLLALLSGLVVSDVRWISMGGAGSVVGYLFGVMVGSLGATVGCGWTRVSHHRVPVEHLPRQFDDYKIVQLSDLHIGGTSSDKIIRKWIDTANALDPDLVVITGDLVTSGTAFHRTIAEYLASVRARDGVVFVPGNHDYFGEGQPLFSLLESHGVSVLRNQALRVERDSEAISVVGVDDEWTGRADVPKAMAARARDSLFNVGLVHNPELAPELAELGADLVLSGHTHGGQLAVPWLARWASLTSWSNPYPIGLYQLGACKLIVSAGLGCTGLPIRFGVRPEIVVVHLCQQ